MVAGGLGLAGLLYFLIHLGPRPVDLPEQTGAMTAEQWRVSHQIDGIERRYRQKADPAGPPARAREDELAQAIAWQERLVRARPTDVEQTRRLERLQTLRDTSRAEKMWPEVEAAEARLHEGLLPGERVSVLEVLLAMRREINRSHAEARYKDIVRVTQLEREFESAQARPLRDAAEAALAEAKRAAVQQSWAEALTHYTRAREALDELNLKFSRTRYADLGLQARVKAEEDALQGAPQAAEIAVYEQGGDAAVQAGQVEAAAIHYRTAMDLQTELNQRWPRSRFFSTTRLDLLDAKRQTALAGRVLAAMHEEDRAVEALLARRQTLAAAGRISAVQELAAKLGSEYAKSRRSDDGLVRKYAFLATLAGTLRSLQDQLYDQLVPLPNAAHRMLLRAEVSQELYTRIMKINPSREGNAEAPVDSVTWTEASEFCRRLSWVLGQPVHLPTEAEFLQALGDTAYADGKGAGVALQDQGFCHLRDGMAEWLAAEPDATVAAVAPGDAEGAIAAGALVFSQKSKSTRDRSLGFRVVVETTEF